MSMPRRIVECRARARAAQGPTARPSSFSSWRGRRRGARDGSGTEYAGPCDFVHDVAPVLSRVGCNAGTCHGSAQGKNGFKLSLRGYDPIFDVRALTDDQAGRHINVASPDNSMMLLKPTGAGPARWRRA